MTTELVFHEAFTKHIISPGHPERPERITTALDFIRKAGIFDSSKVKLLEPQKADLAELYLLHSRNYVETLCRISEGGGGYFTLDTAANRYTFDAALLAAGGGVVLVDRILAGNCDNGYLLGRPPGHHAEYERAFGFCFFNNIALAALHLVQKCGLKRVMIVDYDAHHGNGTQNAFYNRSDVLYIGLHQDGRTLFPGTGFPDEIGSGKGKGYNVNVAMYPGAGNLSFQIAFEEIVEPAAESFKPEFILTSVGFDGHFNDPLTSLGLTTAGLAMMNRRLKGMAEEHSDGKLALFLEGGYDLEIVSRGSLNIIEELSGAAVTKFADVHDEDVSVTQYTKTLIDELKANLRGLLF